MFNKKSKGSQDKKIIEGGLRGVVCNYFFLCVDFSVFRGAGGGKCPEEEHTTCSGGPTILVTSAVYGEREKRERK
jgi:hypothetical protein